MNEILLAVQKLKDGMYPRRNEDRFVLYVTQATLDEIKAAVGRMYGWSLDAGEHECDFRFNGCDGFVVSDRHPPFRVFVK
jgi:hypothetical protein